MPSISNRGPKYRVILKYMTEVYKTTSNSILILQKFIK
jgi:hypothetical protein